MLPINPFNRLRKKRRPALRRFLSLLALLSLLAAPALPGVSVRAAGPIEPDRPVTLTLACTHEGRAIPDAAFSVYRVGAVDAYGRIRRVGPFAGYPVDTEGLDQKGWNALALTLSGYVQRDGVPALDSGRTGTDGRLRFPTGSTEMKPGLYLVTGAACTVDHEICTPSPFMVFLPGADQAGNSWQYDVTVNPKYAVQPETVTRKVLKIWEDRGYEEKRPKSLTVELLRDGEVFDRVALTEQNNWRHTWSGLSGRHSWTVSEQAPAGYRVKVERTGITFTIRNTYVPPAPPPTTPPKKPPQIPKTGQLWWPVPVLSVLGLLFVILGLLKRKCA